jgi:hypothetical protein
LVQNLAVAVGTGHSLVAVLKLKFYTYLLVRWLHRTNFGPIWFFAWPPGDRNQKYF